jgi:tryptophan 2,3-dioxygenase
MLHEMHAVRAHLQSDDLAPAFKMLARVARIMDQLVHAWDVLATMTPPEYTAIRPYLGASSGFQSYQYREIEFILGNKNAALLNVHTTAPEAFTVLDKALREPSVYDEAIKLLARNGLPISTERLNADWTLPTAADESVQNAWLEVPLTVRPAHRAVAHAFGAPLGARSPSAANIASDLKTSPWADYFGLAPTSGSSI